MKTMKWLGGSVERLIEDSNEQEVRDREYNLFNARLTVVSEYACTNESALHEIIRDSIGGDIVNSSMVDYYCNLGFLIPQYRSVPMHKVCCIRGKDIASWIVQNLPDSVNGFWVRIVPFNGNKSKIRTWIYVPEV